MPKQASKPNAASQVLQVLALADPSQYELMVYGDIGENWFDDQSISARDVVDQLDQLGPQVNQVNVRINSVGGSVNDGLAIYNALKRVAAKVIVTVEGVAMSVASLIAMAGDEVHVPSTSVLMIHAPWAVTSGNASELRAAANALDTFGLSMAGAYASKTGLSTDEVLAKMLDGLDHYYTGEQAIALGLADTLITDEPATDPGAAAPAEAPSFAASVRRYTAQASTSVQRLAVAAAERTTHEPIALSTTHHRAAAAAQTTGARTMPTANPQATAAEPAADEATITANARAALRTRNVDIKAALEPYMAREGIHEIYMAALENTDATVDSVRDQALKALGSKAESLAGSHIEQGLDESDKLRAAGTSMLLARAGILKGDEADKARQGNPFVGATLMGMAEKFLAKAGVKTRDMSREDMARRVLASSGPQTTSDFQLLLENTLNKVIVGGYNTANFTWNRFCATGTLSDYRPHGRYHLSSFSDLKAVNEAGEYTNGILGDGQKETITATRKGRILEITPEVLINDDLGAFTRIGSALGQAAGRTIEKDVYALFGLNSGNGPTMGDGKPLFDAAHHNIAATVAAPSVTAFDLVRQQMATQEDVGGNDFLDIMPAVWLGPLSIGGLARQIDRSEYDPSVSNKFQVPNIVRNLFRDVIDTPRLAGTAWYALADAGMEPVFEVAFLDGISTPTIQQETNFRTDGIAWKVVHRYGVAAIGWRGIVKNPGA